MNFRRAVLLFPLVLTACTTTHPPAPTRQPAVIVWVSVDGFRHDYLSHPGVNAPFITSLIRDGAYTEQLTPPFPSLTFASHTSEATGADPATHGIPGNTFFDGPTNQVYNFPARPDLLKAEPVWLAAARQGIHTAVFDWPFSQDQKNRGVATPDDVYELAFNSRETNVTRLQKPTTRMVAILDASTSNIENRTSSIPLTFFMAYTDAIDHAGHMEGPDSPEIVRQLNATDKQLAALFASARAYTDKAFSPQTPLYFLLSTDHGMSPVHTGINLNFILKDFLPSPELRETASPPTASAAPATGTPPAPLRLVTGGSTAHLFFAPILTATQRQQLDLQIRTALQTYPQVAIYTPDRMPPHWHFYREDRVGDLFLSLPRGYTFLNRGPAALVSTTNPSVPKGMHAYDPTTNPDMLGFTAMSRTPNNFGGINLGPVDNRRLAPTVATWLGIDPPAQNQVHPLPQVTHDRR